MTDMAHQPELLGYIPTPCPNGGDQPHLLPVHIDGTAATITSRMPLGPDTPWAWCLVCSPEPREAVSP
jgi:hypothetical protein